MLRQVHTAAQSSLQHKLDCDKARRRENVKCSSLITLFSRETYWDIEASKFLHAFLFQDPMHSTYVCLHVCLHANKLISHTEAAACDLKYEQAMISYLMTASG